MRGFMRNCVCVGNWKSNLPPRPLVVPFALRLEIREETAHAVGSDGIVVLETEFSYNGYIRVEHLIYCIPTKLSPAASSRRNEPSLINLVRWPVPSTHALYADLSLQLLGTAG